MNITYETSIGHKVLAKAPYMPLMLAAIVMIVPYYWMVIGAFKSVPELQAAPPTFVVKAADV